ncbi:sigma-70 family RNA polymerase sigma factor [Cellulomonas sp. URHD0024]|uniref:sigma-70 family RNA polymerase sigma factor n=1 Tax=Cellulomonas sp. URHD0024 TaxID=1302620 RepID=UPI0004260CBD|nr:sigma-70 family RNA polymerase sigma factor [Cellulomonas sp. URHD0024]
MSDDEYLARRFEENRGRLTAVAYRMLGSTSEADDAVQDAWLRLHRVDADGVDNLPGWLTTVVARICLDRLRSRASRREDPLDVALARVDVDAVDPAQEAVLADSVGLAMLVVLEHLSPAERLAFVLHDMFAVPFDEIAPMVGRSPEATRQLASRARRRVQGAPATVETDLVRQREVVDAFLTAARGGDFAALLATLDPDVTLRVDPKVASFGFLKDTVGAHEVALAFNGAAQTAELALLGGAVGAMWAPGGVPRTAFAFTIEDGVIVAIDLSMDPDVLKRLDPVPLGF